MLMIATLTKSGEDLSVREVTTIRETLLNMVLPTLMEMEKLNSI